MEKDRQRSQKTRRRQRAQRMQAEKRQTQHSKSKDCDSAEDELPLKEKPKRPPPNRRKKAAGQNGAGRAANGMGAIAAAKESLYEEDIIDGFAIFSFTSYDDLENSLKQLKCGQVTLGLPCDGSKLAPIKCSEANAVLNNHVTRPASSPPPQPSPLRNNSSVPSPLSDHSKKNAVVGNNKNACEISSAATPPSNGTPAPSALPTVAAESTEESICMRNAENLREKPILQQTTSPLRDQRASSHERLSDISSRCSSGKGYMCDSEGDEGDDDKGSDGDLFPSPPSSCKRELPRGAIPNHLPNNLLNGSNGDVPKERSSPSVLAPSSKPQIRVVTPPRYSPKSMQPLQPIPPQPPPPSSLPYSSQLTALSANSAHHSVSGPPAGLVDQHSVPASLQHHYTPPTSQPQPPTSFPPSQHSLPLTHPQYSSTSTLYPPVLNGGLAAVPPQAHSGGHPTHTSHPIYPVHPPHSLITSTPSPLSASSVPTALSSAPVPPCGSPAQPTGPPYVSASGATSNAASQPSSYATPPQLCPLQLSVTSSYAPPPSQTAQPPAAHSSNAYIPPYSSPSQPSPAAHPYSAHGASPSILQQAAAPPSQAPPAAYQPAHGAAHLPNSHHPSGGSLVHGIPNSHHSHQHHPHLQQQQQHQSSAQQHVSQQQPQQSLPPAQLPAPPSSSASHHLTPPIGAAPPAGAQLPAASAPHPQISSGYNHLAPIPPTYSTLSASSAHGRSSTASSVTSDSSTVVVAAPSSYALPPHSNSFSSLYAPYSNTPYLSSHSRTSRSPLPVISAKSTVSNVSASNTTTNMSIPSSAPPMASVATTTVTTSHRDYATTPLVNRSHSPRGHSPTRERDSYSSGVSSLSRTSVHTPISNPSPFSMPPVPVPAPPAHATLPAALPVPPSVPVSSSLNLSNKPSIWGSVGSEKLVKILARGSDFLYSAQKSAVPTTPSAAVPQSITRPSPHNSFAPPLYTPATTATAAHATVPPSVAAASAVPQLHSNPTHPANPFSAESLSQSYEADLLRRELDSRFLASQDRSAAAAAAAGIPAPYLRTEMHHHQHQHTHVHQHTASLLPPPPASAMFPPPALFKDIPKLGSVDSPFYRQAMGIPNYPGYPSTLLHPTLGAATPFAPPTHLPTFTPKQVVDPTKPKPVKTGKWNAMHVRIAWEIYHHQQQKQQAADIKPSKSELLTRTPSHLFPAPARTPHELSPFSTPHRPPGTAFEAHAHAAANPYAALAGNNVFTRYPPTPFPTLSQYPPALHESWARLGTRAVPGLPGAAYPPALATPWNIKPEPGEVDREREQREREQREREQQRERERAEREREREREKERERSKERDRIRREEKQRRLLAQQQAAQQAVQQQQHAAAAAAAAAQQQLSHAQHQHHAQSAQQQASSKGVIRDRSPLRDTPTGIGSKEDDVLMLGRPPPTYLRQAPRTLPPAPQFAHWEHYRYDPFYNPLVAAALREEDQRAKFFASYQGALPPGAHLRKDPSPSGLHVRPDLQLKKEDSSQSR